MSLAEKLNLRQEFIAQGRRNRPGTAIAPTHITIHNTDNSDAGADASAHSKFVRNTGYYMHNGRRNWVSWHYTVDDEAAIQHLPNKELAYHAGSGNSKSVAIEICMHRGINQAAANERAALLTAVLLNDLGIEIESVVPHHKWTGKNCPRLLLDNGRTGAKWKAFVEKVRGALAELSAEPDAGEMARMGYGAGDLAAADPEGDMDHEQVRAQLAAGGHAEEQAATAAAHLPDAPEMAALAGAAAAAAAGLTAGQRLVSERVINVFETGSIRGRYGAISIFRDGPNGIRQITYGRAQTTEYGNLRELVQMYADAGGIFSTELRVFVPRIGLTALVDDSRFKDLLRRAGNEDPVMRETQDEFFERRYFQPALRWSNDHGFTRALSVLVIYDSFIHSGSILPLLRARFPELPPSQGGNEQVWIHQYVDVRHRWLANHSNPVLHPTVYRTRDLAREIARGNWDLGALPIMANGVPVDDRPQASLALHAAGEAVIFIGDPTSPAPLGVEEHEETWCEEEAGDVAVEAMAAAAAPADTAASLAARILENPRIELATVHPSGRVDQATARHNIVDTAAGQKARRSSYQNAPGGTVALDIRMLRGLVALGEQYAFAVSELAGGSHSSNSRHYAGISADVNVINGRHVGASHPDVAGFMRRCGSLGATEVLGPGNAGHSTHVHAAWPRT